MLYDVTDMIVFCDYHRMSVFFFFKQKTAYEMRISDWSSDVCSSDLCREMGPLDAPFPRVGAWHQVALLPALQIDPARRFRRRRGGRQHHRPDRKSVV